MQLQPVVLEGEPVRLDQLCDVGLDAELWRGTTTRVQSRDEMRAYVETALTWQAAGTALRFAIVARGTGKAIGGPPSRWRLPPGWPRTGRLRIVA